jgi:hypothetical protein
MQAFVIDTYKGGLAQREMPDPSRDRATWSSQYPGDEREPRWSSVRRCSGGRRC